MSDPIPPRPWRVLSEREDRDDVRCYGVMDADGYEVIITDTGVYPPDVPTAEHIVRLVNAEPEIVTALEAAERGLHHSKFCDDYGDRVCSCGRDETLAAVRAALAKLRG